MRSTDHGWKPGGYAIVEIDELTVGAWSPDSKPGGPVTQVHVEIKLKKPLANLPMMVMRYTSPRTLKVIIEQLIRYRTEVWPDAEPINPNPPPNLQG